MDSSAVLIVALVAASVGFFASLLVTSLAGNKNKEDAQEKPPAGQTPNPPSTEKKRIEVATLWREPPMGALRVDMGGKSFATSKDMPEDQRRRLRVTMADLDAWLSTGSPEDVIARIPAAPAPPPPAADSPTAPSLLAPLSTSLMQSARLASASSQAVPAAPKSIAGQIDDILQEQIAGTPLEERRVRLVDDPFRGVMVFIGQQKFQGIDTIPDQEVRAAIKRAVKTWESRAEK